MDLKDRLAAKGRIQGEAEGDKMATTNPAAGGLVAKVKAAPLPAKIAAAALLLGGAMKADDLASVAYHAFDKPQAQAAITPAQAMGKVGQEVTVEFPVGSSKYFEYSKTAAINEGRWPKHTFTVRVTGADGPVASPGQTVRATGTVSMYEGKPQLVVPRNKVEVK